MNTLRQEDLDRFKVLLSNTPICPNCGEKMFLVEAPLCLDGLGWGTDVFFLCLNNDCPPFVAGWFSFKKSYGQHASCRYLVYPDGGHDYIAVFSILSFVSSIIDETRLRRIEQEREEDEYLALRLEGNYV